MVANGEHDMLKVLIIEDELELLNNLTSYLNSFDKEFEVFTALSGEEGIVVLENNPDVDLLLTDVRLPGIDGIEVVHRTVVRWPNVKIVVMTAFGSAEMRNAAEDGGALKFIEKPIDLDVLPRVLREAHESRQRRSRAVGGLDILDVAQFVAIARETKVIRFENKRGRGAMVFENGGIVHCATEDHNGADAFFDMTLWGEGSFYELFDVDTARYCRNVEISTTDLLNQATRLSEVIDDNPSGADSLPQSEQPCVEDHVTDKSHGPSNTDIVPESQAGAEPTTASTISVENRPMSDNSDVERFGAGKQVMATQPRPAEAPIPHLEPAQLAELVRLVEAVREGLLMQRRAELDAWYFRHGEEETRRHADLKSRALSDLYRWMTANGLTATVTKLQSLPSTKVRCLVLAGLLDDLSADVGKLGRSQGGVSKSDGDDIDWSILAEDGNDI